MNAFDGWELAERCAIGSSIDERLSAHGDTARDRAEALAPEGSGPGVRVHVYASNVNAAQQRLRFQTAFPHGIGELGEALGQGDPGALEFGLELLSRVEPGAVVELVEQLVPMDPWKGMWMAMGSALSRVDSAQAFELLVTHAAKPYVDLGIARSCYASGANEALSTLHAIDRLRDVSIDPRQRNLAQCLLTYLGRHGGAEVQDLLEDLFETARSELSRSAGAALLRRGDERSLATVARAVGDERPGPARLAIRALLQRDTRRCIDELGGLPRLMPPLGLPLTRDLFSLLVRDAESGERGRPTHDWLGEDARFIELAKAWRRTRELGQLAAALLRRVPKEVAVAPTPRPRRPPEKPLPTALLAEMTAVRARLEHLVSHLERDGYHFVNPRRALRRATRASRRASARIVREVGPLPRSLLAFWQVVGGVDLRGTHPAWAQTASLDLECQREGSGTWLTNPLCVARADTLLEEVLDEAIDGTPHALCFAPDEPGKAGYSAGALSIWTPDDSADAVVEGGLRQETFSEHVQRALRWGGFPGFELIDDRPDRWISATVSAAL